jgi:hypothetical protein
LPIDFLLNICYNINTIKEVIKMMTKEKLVAQIMRECEKEGEPVTKEEAEEMAEMERKAKANRRYEQSDKPRAKAKREPKIDQEKVKIIDFLMRVLADSDVSQLEVKNPQREIAFQLNGEDYSLTLTKHRAKK